MSDQDQCKSCGDYRWQHTGPDSTANNSRWCAKLGCSCGNFIGPAAAPPTALVEMMAAVLEDYAPSDWCANTNEPGLCTEGKPCLSCRTHAVNAAYRTWKEGLPK